MKEIFDSLIHTVNGIVWEWILLPCVFLGGLWFSRQSGWFQIRRFPRSIRETMGKLFSRKKSPCGSVSPFQALCTALAGTMGTGSIVGTCQALVWGGPGSVFWMWIAAVLGMIIKFFEVTLSLHFRVRDSQGEWVGGPMYYIRYGLGKRALPLAVLFALFAVLASLGMGNLAQTGSIASSVAAVVRTFSSQESTERLAVWITGAVTALLLAVAIFGGMKRIGSWSERMIPAAVLVFSFFSLFLLARHIRAIPSAFSLILRCAFSPRAVGGAVAGYGVKKAMYWGLCRSAFSNEAGLGSAGIAHAGAETDHPVRQGFFGIFEVFADTLVVCTLTALTVLVALPPSSLSPNQAGAEPLIAAFATVFGQRASAVIVAASLIVFAFSTLLGWSLYGCRCVSFLVGHQGTALYRLLFVFLSFFGALIPLKTIWQISDTFNGLMAIPNFIALFFLCPTVLSLIQDFEKKHPHRRKNRSR